MLPCLSMAQRERVKKFSPNSSIINQVARTRPLSLSIALQSLRICLKQFCLVTKKARLRAHQRPTRVYSELQTAALCYSMKFLKCHCHCKQNCCGYCKSARSHRLVANARLMLMFG